MKASIYENFHLWLQFVQLSGGLRIRREREMQKKKTIRTSRTSISRLVSTLNIKIERKKTYSHWFVSAPRLSLAVATFPLRCAMREEEEGRCNYFRTCLHRPHWKASVSACLSAAPRDKNKLSSSIFASAALRSSEAISCETRSSKDQSVI